MAYVISNKNEEEISLICKDCKQVNLHLHNTDLQKLFQMGNTLRIPKKIMKLLIKLPNNFVYDFIFKITYGLAVKKMDNYSWANFIKTSYYLKNNF